MGFRIERDVMVPMRDGTGLAADVWIPDGGPAPTLLVRLPYGKIQPGMLGVMSNPGMIALLDAGYAVVYQDCRGAFDSQGTFTALVDEPEDGLDTINWLREQTWCDGNIGGFGLSYLGFTQWASASMSPEGLQAIAPTMTSTDYYSHPFYSEGGAMSWHTVWTWCTLMTAADAQRSVAAGGDPQSLMPLFAALADPQPHLAAMPVEQDLLEQRCRWWSDWMAHPTRDSYWLDLAVADRVEDVSVPALHIGGWFDIFAGNTARTYTLMRSKAGSAEAREGQRLVLGPWDHMSYDGLYRDRPFGPAAGMLASDPTGTHIRFFDRWLRGREDAHAGDAPVRIFVMGINQWRDEENWPLPDTIYTEYFLDGRGQANTADGDGVLQLHAPEATATDRYDYDPADPVPSLGGRIMLPAAINAVGPVDQSPVEARADVLCYTTAVLEDPVEVTGHVSLVLHASSSALDTDFTGKLVDVGPDGRATYLTDGILRARYRTSLAEPEPLEPDEVYELTLDMSVTSNVFLPGHRIRLEVSSSNFPRFDRNTNTGGLINTETLDEAVVASNRILHGPDRPSRLILPIIRR